MVREVPLNHGQITLIDDADLPLLSSRSWHVTTKGYAAAHTKRAGKSVAIYLHRLIIGAPEGAQVDHINEDKLDNRRLNLRLATPSQNQLNKTKPQSNSTTGVRGVYWHEHHQRYIAQVQVDGRQRSRYCRTLEEAAIAVRELRAPYLPSQH